MSELVAFTSEGWQFLALHLLHVGRQAGSEDRVCHFAGALLVLANPEITKSAAVACLTIALGVTSLGEQLL